MVIIVTGPRNGGKTTRLISLYREKKQGDGLVSCKIQAPAGQCLGYEMMRLRTGERLPLAFRAGNRPSHWPADIRAGSYYFTSSAFAFADQVMDDILAAGMGPVYLDEIGFLELSGRGFAGTLRKILPLARTDLDLYLAVRQDSLARLPLVFNLGNYRLLPPQPALDTFC